MVIPSVSHADGTILDNSNMPAENTLSLDIEYSVSGEGGFVLGDLHPGKQRVIKMADKTILCFMESPNISQLLYAVQENSLLKILRPDFACPLQNKCD